MAEKEREFQIAVAKIQSLSDWVNSFFAVVASVLISLFILFAGPFFSVGTSVNETVVFLPNAGMLAIAGGLLVIALALFNVMYMPRRWGGLHSQFIENKVLQSHSDPPTPKTDENRELKLTIKILKDGDRELEVIGMDADSIDKIFKSWNDNIDK
jgi:hypothetical protein